MRECSECGGHGQIRFYTGPLHNPQPLSYTEPCDRCQCVVCGASGGSEDVEWRDVPGEKEPQPVCLECYAAEGEVGSCAL